MNERRKIDKRGIKREMWMKKKVSESKKRKRLKSEEKNLECFFYDIWRKKENMEKGKSIEDENKKNIN